MIVNQEADYYDACFIIMRFFIHYHKNANLSKESESYPIISLIVIWECYPRLLLTVQQSAIDYIGNFFACVDAYLNCDAQGMVSRMYEGKSYLTMLFNFVNECLFDPELEVTEQGYAVGILMIIIHYCYPAMDSVLEPCVQIVQKFLGVLEQKIQAYMNDQQEEETVLEYYLEITRNCVVSIV